MVRNSPQLSEPAEDPICLPDRARSTKNVLLQQRIPTYTINNHFTSEDLTQCPSLQAPETEQASGSTGAAEKGNK